MFLNDMGADRVIVSPKRVHFADIRRIARAVGPAEYVIHMAEHLKPKDIYLLSKLDSNYVMGLDDEVKGINIKAGARTQNQHFADKVAVLMQHMGISNFDQSYIVPFDSVVQARTDAWWPSHPVIAFNPIGRGHARQFSLKTATAVLEHILKATKADVLILIDPARRAFAESIKQQVSQSHRVILAPADTSARSLGDLFACVRRSQAMVSVDTATVHIATGLGKPVFGFYNPKQNDQDFSFVNWSPHCEQSVTQLAKWVSPQVIDAIDIGEFSVLFTQFVKDYGLNPTS
jgi:ADP-heptose:LPS heptosyltransferase